MECCPQLSFVPVSDGRQLFIIFAINGLAISPLLVFQSAKHARVDSKRPRACARSIGRAPPCRFGWAAETISAPDLEFLERPTALTGGVLGVFRASVRRPVIHDELLHEITGDLDRGDGRNRHRIAQDLD
jgi:hypothetical protein